MSRGFGSTFGSAATGEVITTQNALVLATGYSTASWVYINGTGQNANGLIYAAGAGVTTLALRNNSANIPGTMVLTAPWSTTRGDWRINQPATGRWHHLAVTYSGSATTNVPVVYLNGVSVAVTLQTAPVGTFGMSVATATIGNTSTVNWDGMLAHIALWRDLVLTASEALSLANGINPQGIRPDRLIMYCPLDGVNSPELDLVGAGALVTGTRLGTSEPPVQSIYDRDEDMTTLAELIQNARPYISTHIMMGLRMGQPYC